MENRNIYAGIDTSNYSTSAAVYHACDNNIVHDRLLLPVKKGNIGLRQSDAVFLHTKQLPQVLGPLISDTEKIDAVGVSIRPRDLEGSYMPCFLVGKLAASVISDSLHIPLFTFSHQSGHIMAALYSSSSLNLIHHEFIAFHISGGTTECIVVSPDEDTVFKVNIIGGTSDLNAGQAVDRIGALLGLDFPAGPQVLRTSPPGRRTSWSGRGPAGPRPQGACLRAGGSGRRNIRCPRRRAGSSRSCDGPKRKGPPDISSPASHGPAGGEIHPARGS